MNRTIVVCFAIVAIATLDLFALHKGHDGVLLTSSIGVISGLAGHVGGLYTRPEDKTP